MIKGNNFGLKKVLIGGTVFVSMMTSEMAFLLATAKFLNAGMVDQLPLLLFFVSLAAILDFTLHMLLGKYMNSLQSMVVSFLIVVASIIGVFMLRDNVLLYLFLTLLIARACNLVFNTSLNNLADSYVNSRQAKIFLPFIRGVLDVGVITASAVVMLTADVLDKLEPAYVLLVGIALSFVGLYLTNRFFDPVNSDDDKTVEEKSSLYTSIKNSVHFIFKESKLFYYMALLNVFLGGIVVLYINSYNDAFAFNLSGDDLTRYIAMANFVTVSLRSFFNFKFLPKAIFTFGVANLLLVYPLIMFVLTLALVFYPLSLPLATAMFMVHLFSFYSYVTVSSQAMFGLVPHRISQQLFFFIRGVIPAFSALGTAAILLVLVEAVGHQFPVVNYMLWFYVFMTGNLVFALRRHYKKDLRKAFKGEDEVLRGNAIDLMGERIQVEKGEKFLRQALLNTDESFLIRRKALASLVDINNPNSIREMLIVLETDSNAMLRFYAIQSINMMMQDLNFKRFGNMYVTKMLMLNVFTLVYESDSPLAIKMEINKALPLFGIDVVIDFYNAHFAVSSTEVKASMIEALSATTDRGLITILEPYLETKNVDMRVAAILGLWKFPEMHEKLTEAMIDVFSVKDYQHRMASMKLISELKLTHMEDYVLDLVAVMDPKISITAIITSIALKETGSVKVLIRKLLQYSTSGEREMVEFIFKKYELLSEDAQKSMVAGIRSLTWKEYEALKTIFNSSEQFFDLTLVDLFTN